jgi:hypothetical protein
MSRCVSLLRAHARVDAKIANRIKAKGLQKLRWYCQLCQKQCRDENGFKCHQVCVAAAAAAAAAAGAASLCAHSIEA